jgi:hypothetical protein
MYGGRSILTPQIIERRSEEFRAVVVGDEPEIIQTKPINDGKENGEEPDEPVTYKPQKKFLVDTMFPRASRSERKLLSETLDKIFIIIQKSTDKKTSENIIARIKEELK